MNREQFIVDESGNKTAVVLDIERYSELIEAQEELESIREYDEAKASNDEAIPFTQAVKRLRARSWTTRFLFFVGLRSNSLTYLSKVMCAIRDLIASLAFDPRPTGCKKLTGREGWRIRSADHRVIYEINDEQNRVTVLDIGHRRDIYK